MPNPRLNLILRGGTKWSPGYLPGLSCWLETDYGVTASGGKISEWGDRIRPGVNCYQGSDQSQPTLTDDQLSGFPAAIFDGIDDYMNFSDPDLSRNATGISAIAIVKYGKPGTTEGVASFGSGVLSTVTRYSIRTVGSLYATVGRRLDSESSLASVSGGTKSTECYVIQSSTANYNDATASVFVNGSQMASGSFTTTGRTSNTASVISFLGASFNNNSVLPQAFLGGGIVALLVFSQPLSHSDRERVERYLNEKYKVF